MKEQLTDWVTSYKDAAERNALAEDPDESAEYLISLFKAEVDKLTVIGDGRLEANIQKDYSDFVVKKLSDRDSEVSQWTREAQLQHTKKELLGLMEV